MKKFLVIGNPIDHSLSPKLHNYWIKKNKLNSIYGKLEINENESLRTRPILGMQFLDGLKKKGKGKWGDGTVYNGRDGKTYTALMKLKNGRLEVRGYVRMPMLGKSTFFTRD